MTESSGEHRTGRILPPSAWNEILGPFTRASDIPELANKNNQAVVLKTTSGTDACPNFQFDRDENGKLRVNPHIATAWGLLRALHVDQLGENEWSKAATLVQERSEYDGRSWVDVLKDPSVDERVKLKIYVSIVDDAMYAADQHGIKLVDPRTILPK